MSGCLASGGFWAQMGLNCLKTTPKPPMDTPARMPKIGNYARYATQLRSYRATSSFAALRCRKQSSHRLVSLRDRKVPGRVQDSPSRLDGERCRVSSCVSLDPLQPSLADLRSRNLRLPRTPQKKILMRKSPIVAHSHLMLDPDKTGFVGEPPGVDDLKMLPGESYSSPRDANARCLQRAVEREATLFPPPTWSSSGFRQHPVRPCFRTAKAGHNTASKLRTLLQPDRQGHSP